MNPKSRYVLDANVFIEAKKRYYAFDLCPAFWGRLISLHDEGRVLSIDRVREELLQGNDELSEWTRSVKDSFFASSDDAAVVAEFKQVMEWVQGNPQFTAPAKAAFARAADGWRGAFARSNDLVVATDEVYRPDVRKKVPLPNVMQANWRALYRYLRHVEVARCPVLVMILRLFELIHPSDARHSLSPC